MLHLSPATRILKKTPAIMLTLNCSVITKWIYRGTSIYQRAKALPKYVHYNKVSLYYMEVLFHIFNYYWDEEYYCIICYGEQFVKGLLNQGFPIDIFWNHTSTIKCDTTGVGECESKIICSEIHVSFLLIFLVFLLTWSGVARLSQRLCTGSSMNRILHLIPMSMMLLPNLFRSTFLENLEVSDWFRRWWTLF